MNDLQDDQPSGSALGAVDTDLLATGLLTASRALVAVSARSLAAVEDRVTLAQFRTLVVLDTHGSVRLTELARGLGVGPSTAMRAVDRLIDEGYAVRRPGDHDRREVILTATPAGRRLVAEVTTRRRTAIEEIVEAIPVDRRADIIEALEVFGTAAGEPPVGPLAW